MNFAPHLVQDDASLSGTHAALALADATSSLRVGIPGARLPPTLVEPRLRRNATPPCSPPRRRCSRASRA